MSGSSPGLRFESEWRITLFTVVMVPLMIGLGFWQLQRGDEKAALAALFEARQQQHPASIDALWNLPDESLAYLRVQLSGSFLPDAYFLLDNQVRAGKVGYQVLGILQLSDQTGSVLVNRGWIAGDADREALPEVPDVAGRVEITGHVYVAPGAPYLLAEQRLSTNWPKRIQAVEMDKIAPAMTGLAPGEVFPFPVRIDDDQPGALAVEWQVVNSSPQKHQAYAVQWFAMAAVLFVFYLLRSSNLRQLISGSGREGE
jgi:surfeit locus 1 family protein